MDTLPYSEILIRSRITILEMLEYRGYDTTPYAKLVGPDLLKLMPDSTNPEGLMMEVKHRSDPNRRAIVEYTVNRIKQSLPSFLQLRIDAEQENPEVLRSTEYIIVTGEEIVEGFHKAALDVWNRHQMRVVFFNISRLVVNPMKHQLQPKFEYVPPEAHEDLLKEWNCRVKTQFPFIKFHEDPIARYMGLVPKDILKITRPSPQTGEYVLYRTCVP